MENPIQTRSEETGMNNYKTFSEAMQEAEKDSSVWKISFNLNGERVRLIRRQEDDGTFSWVYEPIL